jgi:hypothetical protein
MMNWEVYRGHPRGGNVRPAAPAKIRTFRGFFVASRVIANYGDF